MCNNFVSNFYYHLKVTDIRVTEFSNLHQDVSAESLHVDGVVL